MAAPQHRALRPLILALLGSASTTHAFRAPHGVAQPALLRRQHQRAATVAVLPPETSQFLALEEVGPVLISQLVVVGGLNVGGLALDTFFEVDEPKEPGAEDGAEDIYRDSPLRYLGYANEVGEAFRPLVPVAAVYVSYVLAITYILADTVDKGKKGAQAEEGGGAIRGTLGALDTFFWQMLASVVFPSFCINRLVLLLDTLQETTQLPELLTASWLPTAAGLITIPLVILPLDTLAHFVMNQSFRRVSKSVLEPQA